MPERRFRSAWHHFSTTEAALPRRTPVRFADWIEPKQGERRRVAGRLDTESPSLRDLGLPVVALDRSSDFWRAPLEAIRGTREYRSPRARLCARVVYPEAKVETVRAILAKHIIA